MLVTGAIMILSQSLVAVRRISLSQWCKLPVLCGWQLRWEFENKEDLARPDLLQSSLADSARRWMSIAETPISSRRVTSIV